MRLTSIQQDLYLWHAICSTILQIQRSIKQTRASLKRLRDAFFKFYRPSPQPSPHRLPAGRQGERGK